jgi:hypothetical protein
MQQASCNLFKSALLGTLYALADVGQFYTTFLGEHTKWIDLHSHQANP